MESWLVSDGELSKVMPDHLWADFNDGKLASIVHSDVATDHVWEDDGIAQVRSDKLGLVEEPALLLGLAEALEQARVLENVANLELWRLWPDLSHSAELALDAGREHANKLSVRHVQELIKILSLVLELLEGVLSAKSQQFLLGHVCLILLDGVSHG